MTQEENEICNVEAERQLLGKLMLDNSLYWQISTFLKPDDFHSKVHEDLFSNMGKLISSGKSANPITLKPMLPDMVGRLTGIKYAIALSGDPTATINVPDYAKVIADLGARRRLIQACRETVYECTTSSIDVCISKIVDQADGRLIDVRNSIPDDNTQKLHIDDITDDCLTHMHDVLNGKVPEMPSTGYKDLDRQIGGWGRQRFYVIGARPGQGKTAFATASMRKVVRQQKKEGGNFGAMYFSLEVPGRDIWSRLVASECANSHTPIEYREIQTAKYLNQSQVQAVGKYADALRKFPIRICDKPGLTITQIEAEARAEKQRMERIGQSLDVIFIDYMQIVQAGGRYGGNKVNEIGEISMGCLNMARRLDIAVVATAQLSRGVESRDDKRPVMSDLRESGQIEQDANSIVFLYRPAYYDRREAENTNDMEKLQEIEARKNDLYLLVEKSRDGTPGKVKTYCDIGLNCIENAA